MQNRRPNLDDACGAELLLVYHKPAAAYSPKIHPIAPALHRLPLLTRGKLPELRRIVGAGWAFRSVGGSPARRDVRVQGCRIRPEG